MLAEKVEKKVLEMSKRMSEYMKKKEENKSNRKNGAQVDGWIDAQQRYAVTIFASLQY